MIRIVPTSISHDILIVQSRFLLSTLVFLAPTTICTLVFFKFVWSAGQATIQSIEFEYMMVKIVSWSTSCLPGYKQNMMS